jgi:ABC-type glycerol-3-phosphate transport system substrate-binding protein
MTIDPLVMYYNRSMLDANGIVSPPDNWDDFIGVVPTLTQRDERNKIIKSAVAFGHFSNISHAKNVLSTLFMQSGNKIVSEKEGRFVSDLMVLRSSYSLSSILEFYTDFADPQKNIYSWNKSLPFSRDFFSTDKLAFYFGYASELSSLISKNPNQNFLVAEIPQIQNANFKLTSAKITGLAISAFSKNANTAFIVANKMSSGDFVSKLAKNLKVVPARRDLLAIKQTDAYFPTFYSSALYAKGWLDPSSKDTDDIFRKMINGVSSNNLDVRSAISDASAKLSLLLNR